MKQQLLGAIFLLAGALITIGVLQESWHAEFKMRIVPYQGASRGDTDVETEGDKIALAAKMNSCFKSQVHPLTCMVSDGAGGVV